MYLGESEILVSSARSIFPYSVFSAFIRALSLGARRKKARDVGEEADDDLFGLVSVAVLVDDFAVFCVQHVFAKAQDHSECNSLAVAAPPFLFVQVAIRLITHACNSTSGGRDMARQRGCIVLGRTAQRNLIFQQYIIHLPHKLVVHCVVGVFEQTPWTQSEAVYNEQHIWALVDECTENCEDLGVLRRGDTVCTVIIIHKKMQRCLVPRPVLRDCVWVFLHQTLNNGSAILFKVYRQGAQNHKQQRTESLFICCFEHVLRLLQRGGAV